MRKLLIFILFSKKFNLIYSFTLILIFLSIYITIKIHPSYNDYKIIESNPNHNGLLIEKFYNCNDNQKNQCSKIVKSQPKFIEVLKDFKNSAYGEIYSVSIKMYKNNLFTGLTINVKIKDINKIISENQKIEGIIIGKAIYEKRISLEDLSKIK